MSSYADELYRLGKRLDEQMAQARQAQAQPLPESDDSLDYDTLTMLPGSIPNLSEHELKFVFAQAARRGDISILQAVDLAWTKKLFTVGLEGALSDSTATPDSGISNYPSPEIVRFLIEGGAAVSARLLHSLASEGDADTLDIILSSRKFPSTELLILLDTPDASGQTLEVVAANFRTREVLRARRVLALAAEAQDRYKTGSYSEAENFYAAALDLCGPDDPNRAKLMYNLARALYRQGRYVRAVQYCTESLALDRSYLNSYRCRAYCYIGLLDFDRALADLDICRENFRLHRVLKDMDAYAILGIVNFGTSESEVRAAFREKARKFHPDKQFGASEEVRSRCAIFFPKIQQAYEVLMDPIGRIKFPAISDLSLFLDSPEDGLWTPEDLLEGTKENFRKNPHEPSLRVNGGRMSMGGEDEF
jgi:tetratricopeptide (TPR) repeat protein